MFAIVQKDVRSLNNRTLAPIHIHTHDPCIRTYVGTSHYEETIQDKYQWAPVSTNQSKSVDSRRRQIAERVCTRLRKALLPMMPGRTHASLACRYQKLQNKETPDRVKIAAKGTSSCKHSKRRSDAARLAKATQPAPVNGDGTFLAVKNLVDRALSTIIQKAKARDYQKEYNHTNRKEIQKRENSTRKKNKNFRIRKIVSSRFGSYLKSKGVYKSDKTEYFLKMSYKNFVSYLENLLFPGEVLAELEVDHIFPFFVYDVFDASELAKCQHFSNMQPLTRHENRNKKNKLPTKSMAARVPKEFWPRGVTEDMLPDCYDGWRTSLRM